MMGVGNMWAAKTYERTIEAYKELMQDSILSIKSDGDLKLKEYLIRAEIQKCDFTKRQLNILSLIVKFSFNFGKESALLQISDFEQSGISVKKIRSEIDQLIEMNVINWDTDFNEFSINDPLSWVEVPYHKYYSDTRSIELFFLNLKHAGVDVESFSEKLKELDK
jgi:hypothetical protein